MLTKKKILVIGAGLAQVDAIKRAKETGYYVLASDGQKDAEGLKTADEGRVIDVKDVETNLAWAVETKIDGVISYATDVSLPTVLAIRSKLNLPGLSRIPMEVSLDKSQQRERFLNAGLAQPDFEIVCDLKDLKGAADKIGFPLVIKPVDNSGSRGVALVDGPEQLQDAFSAALENSKNRKVVLEEFVSGTELTIEGLSVNGHHHILAISDKFKPEGSYRVATQLAYPAELSDSMKAEVIKLITSAYDAAEVDNTPTHSEIIVTPDGPKIVEIGCRGGGFYVFTRVVEAASGYDIIGNWTRMCVGDIIDEPKPLRRGVVLRFYAAVPGKLVSVKGVEEAKKMEGVETDLFLKPGDIIPELKTDGSRTGWMLVRGNDRAHAIARADIVSETVKFETESWS